MSQENIAIGREEVSLGKKLSGLITLVKPRLSFLVVFSAWFGYLMGAGENAFTFKGIFWISLGGFLVTGASNALNQVLEVEFDKLMIRTRMRPLPTGVLTSGEALILALVAGISGILILGFIFNLVTALLGIIALLSYAFVYTPLKRLHPISVFVGAFPGALPPLIGWAASGEIGLGALVVFLIQFIWQFPHFWAIAWLLDEDYAKAGFKMLPLKEGKGKATALLILIYTSLLIPASFAPFFVGTTSWLGLSTLLVCGIGFTYQALKLFKNQDNASARGLMFGSFLYLPLVQIAMVLDKIWI